MSFFFKLTIMEYDCPHGFFTQGDESDCSEQAFQDMVDFLTSYVP